MKTVGLLAGASILAFVLLIVVIIGAGQDQPGGLGADSGGGVLNVASVPAALGPWLAKAAALCSQIGAPYWPRSSSKNPGSTRAPAARSGLWAPPSSCRAPGPAKR
jgi:hypothetical protein